MMKRFIAISIAVFLIISSFVPVFAADDGWSTDISENTTETLSPIDSSVTGPGTTQSIQNSQESNTNILRPEDENIVNEGAETRINNPNPVLNDETFRNLDDESQRVYAGYRDIIPMVETDDILQWILEKGYQIIHLLQVVVQPFSIIIFIIGAFLALIGSIGRGDLSGKGMWAMIISTIVYAVVLFAPVIMQTFVGWVSS